MVRPSLAPLFMRFPQSVRVPTVDAWNVTLQHELTPNMYFEVAYVGNKGTHVLTDSTPYYNLNVPRLPVARPDVSNEQHELL